MKKCPFCAEQIQDEAKICRFCQRDLATGQPPIQTVVTVQPAPQWSPGVAAVLSLVIPGAGQMYKGEVGAGLAWLFFVILGYFLFIIPGIILHLICIVTAASGAPQPGQQQQQTVRPETPPPTPEERAAATKKMLVGLAIVAVVLGLFATFAVLNDRAERAAYRTSPSSSMPSATPAMRHDVLDEADWNTKLHKIVLSAGEPCKEIVRAVNNGRRGAENIWSVQCRGAQSYAITLTSDRSPTIAPCGSWEKTSGVQCFAKLKP